MGPGANEEYKPIHARFPIPWQYIRKKMHFVRRVSRAIHQRRGVVIMSLSPLCLCISETVLATNAGVCMLYTIVFRTERRRLVENMFTPLLCAPVKSDKKTGSRSSGYGVVVTHSPRCQVLGSNANYVYANLSSRPRLARAASLIYHHGPEPRRGEPDRDPPGGGWTTCGTRHIRYTLAIADAPDQRSKKT